MLCGLVGDQLQQLIEILLRIEAARNVEQRGVLIQDRVRRFPFDFHIIVTMNNQTFSAFPKEGLQFLRSLKRHNNREWFQKHKGIYEKHVKQPMADLIDAMAKEFQQFAPEMIASPRVSAYRIYRDTRFS